MPLGALEQSYFWIFQDEKRSMEKEMVRKGLKRLGKTAESP